MTCPTQNATFEGQTVIITGANTGLGFEAARYMVKHRVAKLIIACRNLPKGEVAKKRLEDETRSKDVIEVWELDLASYSSIKEFASRADQTLDRLDIVICSAGIDSRRFGLVNDIEKNISINVVSTFLLALLLLPKLKSTGTQHQGSTPHLAIVSSDTHFAMNLDEQHETKTKTIFEQLNDKKQAQMVFRYPLSKLLDILLTKQLVAHLPQDYPVIVNTINPGLCHSELQREGPKGSAPVINFVFNARTPEEGIQNYIFGVSAGREWHGKYISECREGPLGPAAKGPRSEEVGARLWVELIEILDKISPGIASKL